MRAWLRALRLQWREDWEYICFSYYHDRMLEPRGLPLVLYAIREIAQRWWTEMVCRIKGHDLVDDGYGTPDHGCIDVNCHRCGKNFGRQWLY